jgi:hypothetical protein
MQTHEITFTEDEAEEAIMGWEIAGKLPPFWTLGTLASAYIAIAAREHVLSLSSKECPSGPSNIVHEPHREDGRE